MSPGLVVFLLHELAGDARNATIKIDGWLGPYSTKTMGCKVDGRVTKVMISLAFLRIHWQLVVAVALILRGRVCNVMAANLWVTVEL